ncbi:hypothetical protein [Capillimicrobium parvum]|uniref:Uncharacterized protein n=1 Tax=Capillimicrobium parvum TaxID=2884022 RepID=A0A9E7C103_9ACTN|nr:hypothetical protein [Capillimicrobium parvum]UGS35923.1 hypothetical protein DSM104329_02320 [Capillimicrobium parvum]
MELKVQLKLADGSVASSLGYESAVSSSVESLGLRMYPMYPGTQDSRQGTMFRVPVPDEEAADRALALLREHEGVQSAALA